MQNKSAAAAAHQLASAWDSQQDDSQHSSLNTSEFAQDNIYEVCGERSAPAVEITVQGSPNPMQVTLPPENPPGGGRYGSIPHLDSSPRRYRYIDEPEPIQSDSPAPNLSVPGMHRLGSLSQSNEMTESPPKLPERAPKTLHTGAPPPLPPKKPLSNQNSKTSIKNVSMNNNVAMMAACFAETARNDDIYDFVPEPVIGNVSLNQEEAKQCISDILKGQQSSRSTKPVLPDLGSVTIEELSRMSVMELNEKMTAGLLPSELTGMSIFELVNFVGRHMRIKKEMEEEEEEEANEQEMMLPTIPQKVNDSHANNSSGWASMKPSFSDNFIAEKLISTPKTEPTDIPQSNVTTDIISGLCKLPLTNMSSNLSSNADETTSKGFEDDFAHFHLPTSSISGRESSVSDSMTDQEKESAYDKYAVFRELQMEEELLRAWKTPSEEEKEMIVEGKSDNDDDDDEEEEDKEDYNEDKPNDLMGHDEDSQERPICSSEGSPRSRSDTGSIQKSVSEDGTLDDLKIGSEIGEGILEAQGDHHDPKRESQIPIFFVEEGNGEEMSEEEEERKVVAEDVVAKPELQFDLERVNKTHKEPESLPDANKFEHNFDEAFGPAGDLTITKDWTTFDDGPMEATQDLQGATFRESVQQEVQQDFSMEPFSVEEEKERELEFERLREQELRQQQILYEEHQRLQAELQHQHALQRELQFHQQVI